MKRGDAATVATLLQNGANLFHRNGSYRFTPLHYAVFADDQAVIRLLINRAKQSGQSARLLNAQDGLGCTPLSWAAGTGKLRSVRLLLAAGAGHTLRSLNGKTALHYAAANADRHSVQICTLLLQSGAEPGMKDNGGETPGDIARRLQVRVPAVLLSPGRGVRP